MSSYRSYGLSFGQFITPAVKKLLIINAVVFFTSYLFRSLSWGVFAMTPAEVLYKFKIWQLFTYMFLHDDIMHLLWNMIILYFCGPAIEKAWGSRQFLIYYFFCGVGAALCSFVFSYNASIIGSSGAMYGLLVACAFMFPEAVVLVFFLFPMKIKYFVFLIMGISAFGALSSSGDGIAHFAHLGGGLFGFIYFKNEWIRFKLSQVNIAASILKKKPAKKQFRGSRFRNLDTEVDKILDKISKKGMNSLTKEERRTLDEKSRKN